MKVFSYMLVLALALGWKTGLARPLQLVSGNGFEPYADSSLPDGRLFARIIKTALKSSGQEFDLSFEPWARGLENTRIGVYQGAFPFVQNTERERIFLFSKPVITLRTYFFAQKKSRIIFEKDENLSGLRVCKPIGYRISELQRFLDKKILQIERAPTIHKCFQMLAKGRVNLISISEGAGQMAIDKSGMGPDVFEKLPQVIEITPFHFVTARKGGLGQEWMDTFNGTIIRLQSDGTIDRLIREYHSSQDR